MPRKYVSVEGIATLVHHRGPTTLPGSPPDLSRGAPLICLHDAGDNGATFAGVLDALAATHSPLAYDQPGHGRSASLDSLGAIDAMASHARRLADALDARRPVLLGAGMGAAVALEAALADPAWPRALVLCDGPAAAFDVDDAAEALELVVAGKARREFDTSGYAPDTPREVYQRAFGEWIKTDPRATLGDRRAQQRWSAEGRLSGLDVAALVVIGAHQEPDGRARAEALAAQLPRARTAELAGAGRRGVLEQPAALAALVEQFVAEVGS